MINETVALTRDTEATIIPAGDVIVLEKGSEYAVSQALGGTVTLKSDYGLFRISNENLDALGLDMIPEVEPEPSVDLDQPFSDSLVWEALKGCFDPEIPINIVDLGLVYDMVAEAHEGGYKVGVKMTLTAQGCGMGPSIAADAKAKIEAIPHVSEATVDIVWDPVWTPQMISQEGRKVLGL